MQAKELRIGNIIQREDIGNGLQRVENIIELGQKAITTGPVKVIIEYDDISPVPITEEWLLKAGFELQQYGYFNKSGIGFITGKSVDGTFVAQNSWGPRHVHIYYVHQLQNLFYDLIGQELTLAV